MLDHFGMHIRFRKHIQLGTSFILQDSFTLGGHVSALIGDLTHHNQNRPVLWHLTPFGETPLKSRQVPDALGMGIVFWPEQDPA